MLYLYLILSILAGFASTAQVGVNGRLLSLLSSPILTSAISFGVGTLGLLLSYWVSLQLGLQTIPSSQDIAQTNWWMWLGGLLGAFFVLITVLAAPKIGFANMFSLIIAGQILFAILLDHFGVLGPVQPINSFRLIGVFLLIAGVYIIQTH